MGSLILLFSVTLSVILAASFREVRHRNSKMLEHYVQTYSLEQQTGMNAPEQQTGMNAPEQQTAGMSAGQQVYDLRTADRDGSWNRLPTEYTWHKPVHESDRKYRGSAGSWQAPD